MKPYIKLLLIAFATATWSCSTTKVTSFDTLNYAGEENYHFKLVTSEAYKIEGPDVKYEKGSIRWNTGSVFDVSPDGENIVYITLSEDDNNKALNLLPLTSDTLPVRRTCNIAAANPRFSPDGLSICFSGTLPGQTSSGICIIDTYDNNGIRHLTGRDGFKDSSPVFSSDGERIIFTRGIPTIRTEGSNTVTTWDYSIWAAGSVITGEYQYIYGSSPDYLFDNRIVYTKTNTISYQGEIWIYDLVTGNDSLLLAGNGNGFSTPRVSPDGTMILCTGVTLDRKGRPSNLDVYLLNTDGSSLRQLTFHPGADVSPCWSPDGDVIYFMSQRGNSNGLFNIWSLRLSDAIKPDIK